MALGLAICSNVASAQTPAKPYRIGLLSAFVRADVIIFADALRLELKKLGWIDGENVVLLDPRTADGRNERLPLLAEELVRLDPAVIVVGGAPATRALKQASRSIPIVMVAVGDQVAYGLVDSLARPGGNVTGTNILVNESSTKLRSCQEVCRCHLHKAPVRFPFSQDIPSSVPTQFPCDGSLETKRGT